MKKTRKALVAISAASLAVSSIALAAPAQALELDVYGATFNFANPGDLDILEDATIGSSYFYENVANVNGTQIDATVTFVDASDNSMGMNDYETLDQADIDEWNLIDANSVDTPGCYSSATYIDNFINGNGIWWNNFFVPGDLLLGEKLKDLDEFVGDPASEGAINSDIDLCEITDPTIGYVTIRVDFESGGSPVTLKNLAVHAGDIDSLQSLTLLDPAPTHTYVSANSKLTVTEVAGVSAEFKSPDISSSTDDPDAEDFVGEGYYDSVSSLSYRFALEDQGGGSLAMLFDSYFNPPLPESSLPNTGVDVAANVLAGSVIFLLGAAAVLIARRRRQSA